MTREKTNVNIAAAPKVRKEIKGVDPRYNSLEDLEDRILVSNSDLASLQEASERSFDEEPFVIVLTDEPKNGNLLTVLKYNQYFPKVYFMLQHDTNDGTLADSLIPIEKEAMKSFDTLPIEVQNYLWKSSYNNVHPASVMSDGWTLSQRVLINMLHMYDPQTLTLADLNKWKNEHGIKIDLKTAFQSFSSPQNDKLHILINDNYPFVHELQIFEVNRAKFHSIFCETKTESLLAPVVSRQPAFAYSAYVTMNDERYFKLTLEAIEAPDKISEIPDKDLESLLIIEKPNDPEEKNGVFVLNKNLPITAYTSENPSILKISHDFKYGEYLNDKTLPVKYIENYKSFPSGFSSEKISLADSLRNHLRHLSNIASRLDDESQAEVTEFDHNYMRSTYSSLSSEHFKDYIKH